MHCRFSNIGIKYNTFISVFFTFLMMGAEDTGLSPALLEVSDHRCRIPMQGAADSLNVSVAAAILVYEALRQRSLSP